MELLKIYLFWTIILLLLAFDGFSTIYLIGNGLEEANLVIAKIIESKYSVFFFSIRLLVWTLLLPYLMIAKMSTINKLLLFTLFVAYGILSMYHIFLIFGVIG